MRGTTLLAGACVAALIVGTPAAAQDATGASPAAVADATPADAIVVTGIRRSLEKGLQVKRLSNEIMDSVVATDVAKLPDNTIAESLQRVSGVQIRRALGVGTSVSIRGLRQNRTEVNGRTLINPSGRGRNADAVADADYGPLSLFPSELISRLDVIKLQGADRPDGSLSGTVDVITRKPLDSADRIIAMSASGVYADQAKRSGYDASALYSNSFADQTFGILLNVTYARRPITDQSFNSFTGYTPLTALFNTTANPKANDPNGDGIPGIYIADLRFQNIRETREQIGGNAAFQWRPTDRLEVYGDVVYAHLTTDRNRDWSSIPLSTNGADYLSFTLSPAEILTAGTIRQFAQTNAEVLHVSSDTISGAVGIKWKSADDRFTVRPEFNYADSTLDSTQTFVRLTSLAKYDFAFDLNQGGVPKVTAPTGLDFTNPASFRYSNVFDNFIATHSRETAGRIDFTYKPTGGFISSIDTGMRYAALTADRQSTFRQIAFAGSTPANTFLASTGSSSLYGLRDFGGQLRGQVPTFLTRYIAATPFGTGSQFGCEAIASSALCGTRVVDPLQSFVITEKTLAAYARVNFAGQLGTIPVSGNIGMRYSDTERSAVGSIRRASGVIDPLVSSTRFHDWLPSATIKFELNDKLQLRLGAAKVLGLPDTIDLSPNLQLNRLSPYNGSAGNPNLKPIRADQIDASLEWYFAPGSAFTVGAFYKNVKTFIFNQAAFEVPPGEVAPDPLGQGWLITRPYNGTGGKIRGVEVLFQTPFNFLPAPLDGFGVVANLSYIDSSTSLKDRKGATLPLQGLSKVNYNLVGYFEKWGFGARLAYNYRSRYFDSVGPGATAVYFAPFRSVDGSLRYEFGRFTVSLDAANLTNSVQRKYTESPEATSLYALQGRRFTLGFNAKF
ncbi:TonB-dependent receptor [Novosphingobium sp.]|uniref:TonB-dependent receptor n=1 Tax=Novosphingobium sp. TaxID=1874826 RepID=UPI00262CC783|nr:TonB-dependent receptor [Novosphingobium sp.]